jgi:hypothetical protein
MNEEYISVAEQLFADLGSIEFFEASTWQTKQKDQLDYSTKFIFQTDSRSKLETEILRMGLDDPLSSYARHRWRNFKRHDAWLFLLAGTDHRITLEPNKFHKTVDFRIELEDLVEFDLKITRFPHTAPRELSKNNLIEWLYKNQSSQQRFHIKNRFFIVSREEKNLYSYEKAKKQVEEFTKLKDVGLHKVDFPNGASASSILLLLT